MRTLSIILKVLILSAFFYCGCNRESKGSSDRSQEAVTPPSAKIEIKTFKITDNCWGYDIYLDRKRYIHQPNIPAVSGNKNFKTEFDAKKIAILTKEKMQNNIMPPSISKEELDSLININTY